MCLQIIAKFSHEYVLFGVLEGLDKNETIFKHFQTHLQILFLIRFPEDYISSKANSVLPCRLFVNCISFVF